MSEELIYILLTVALAVIGVAGYVLRKRFRGTATEALIEDIQEGAETAIAKERNKHKPLAVIAFLLLVPTLTACSAVQTATDAYRVLSGAQDTSVIVHKFDTLVVKIIEQDTAKKVPGY